MLVHFKQWKFGTEEIHDQDQPYEYLNVKTANEWSIVVYIKYSVKILSQLRKEDILNNINILRYIIIVMYIHYYKYSFCVGISYILLKSLLNEATATGVLLFFVLIRIF